MLVKKKKKFKTLNSIQILKYYCIKSFNFLMQELDLREVI